MSPEAEWEMRREPKPRTTADKIDAMVAVVTVIGFLVVLAVEALQ